MKICICSSLNEMSNVPSEVLGIKNVIMWIGEKPGQHGHRVKISNVPNTFSKHDNFTIMIPSLKKKGIVNESFIKSKIYDKILLFVSCYTELIIKKSQGKISMEYFTLYVEENPIGCINPSEIIEGL